MKRLRILLRILVLIVLMVGIGGFIVFNDITRGVLPKLDGEITLTGLDAPVTVKRDAWGVSHIYATTPHDLFMAQGYVQAQDRWWQMEFWRAIGSGRVQELTGQSDEVMSQDVFIRTIGWRRAAERDAKEVYDAETLALIQAFADGVNAYIGGKSGGDLALEYSVLGINGVNIPVRAWTIEDTLVWQKVMSWDLSNQLADLGRAENIAQVGEALYADFETVYPFEDMQTIVREEDYPLTEASLGYTPTTVVTTAMNATPTSAQLAGNFRPGTRFVFGEGEGIGSNNWVVSGELTDTGMPLLANDPHLGVQMPSIWYEIGLHCRPMTLACPYDVHGFAFAAFPGVVIGHNNRIAWGFTNAGPDVMDVYKIEINPDNPLQYKWDGEWRDIIVHEEVIRFGDMPETVTIRVRETHIGPIINDNELDENGQPLGFNNTDPLALRWTALDPSRTLDAIFKMNVAQNFAEFRAAASLFDAPSQNLVYADIDGNIGYQTPSLIPIRPSNVSGLIPIEGSSSANEWRGYIPFDLLPCVYNPERGYIHSANEALVPLSYYDWLRDQLKAEYGEDINVVISTEWDYGYRGKRIVEILESGAPFTLDEFKQLQGDNKFIPAEQIMPYLMALTFDDPKLTEARDWLATWDAQMHMDSPQAALFGQFWTRLMVNLYKDQLDYDERAYGSSSTWATISLLESPDNSWWDYAATSDVNETRDDILKKAFSEGYAAAEQALGTDRATWKWGALHTTTFVSRPLGLSGIDLIENIVNRGPVMTSGSRATVNAASWNMGSGDNFTVTSGASFRMIVDLSNLDHSVNMHTTGQSGHPYSPFYDSMIDSWRKVDYKPMNFSDDAVNAAAEHTLTLKP